MRKSFLQAIKKEPNERPQDLPHPNGMSFGAIEAKREFTLSLSRDLSSLTLL